MTVVLARAVMETSAQPAPRLRRAAGPQPGGARAFASRALGLALTAPILLAPGASPARASALFEATELNEQSFVLVAAPIGTGERAQLNIYEQIRDTRPCYAVSGGQPSLVEPLLSTFDFTGICGRFIDANGYSLRVGGTDLASSYRLSVVRSNGDNLLLAVPTKPGGGPEMVVARTQGPGSGFLQLVFESGWQLKRRAYQGRKLGHIYLYRDTWPGEVAADQSPPMPLMADPSTPAVPPGPIEVPVLESPPAPMGG